MITNNLMLNDWITVHHVEQVMVPLSETEITSETKVTENTAKVGIIADDHISYLAWCALFQRMIWYSVPLEEIRPVQLTEEIIHLNGIGEDGKYQDENVSIDYAFYDGFNFSIRTDLMEVNVKVWPVHEWQNALRLCGLNEMADSIVIEKEKEDV